MSVLLLRLCGPLQSWGVQSHFPMRDTGLEPSKSGVVGLLCAALGRERTEPLDDLAALRMGARVDREGVLRYDFHTALNVLSANGVVERKNAEISRRYYLADAAFLAGLDGEDEHLLQRIQAALQRPVWPLYLGRKAFVPGEPVYLPDGLGDGSLAERLLAYPRLHPPRHGAHPALRFVVEDDAGTEVRPDQPVSFAQRTFAPRRVRTFFHELAAGD